MSQRLKSLHHWLEHTFKNNDYKLMPVSGDASFRLYYRLFIQNKTFIVMDASPAHEDCQLFIQVTDRLHSSKVNVPIIYHKNLEEGFLILTDFGDDIYLKKINATSANQLYSDAIVALVKIQTFADIAGLNLYDEALLRQEINLFSEWLLKRYLKIDLRQHQQRELEQIFKILITNALTQPRVFVHRDFHSRNLLLTQANNPGIIDYQDAVYGPLSYDLVSLLKDCYIKLTPEQICDRIDIYINALASAKPELKYTRSQFQRWFDLMGVQRHLKASGIFARLALRDGKPSFLQAIPQTLSYIVDLRETYPNLEALGELIEESILPKLEGGSCAQ